MTEPFCAEIRGKPKAVVITGTSTGIGRATALLLDQAGYQVFAGVRREEHADALRQVASARLRPVFLDITVQKQIEEAAAFVADCLGPEQGLYGLVNNAGAMEPGSIECMGLERLRHQMEVGFFGHVALIQALMPMIRQGAGRIVNVTSANGKMAMPMMGAYAACKHAMEAMSDALRRELRWWNIPVSVVAPGTVEAALWDNTPHSIDAIPNGKAEDPLRRYAEMGDRVWELMLRGRQVASKPEALAKVIKQALEARHPKARYCCGPGSRLAVFGSVLPKALVDWALDKMIRKQLPLKIMGW